MIEKNDAFIKLTLIGSSGVGKTSILTQFADNKFTEDYLTTIGVDFRFKIIKHENKNIKFQIWDTAGQERFRTITSAYYKGADGIILVYDVTNPVSLNEIQQFWIPQAQNYCDKSVSMILLGNKSDRPSAVAENSVKQITEKYHIPHFAVSAKDHDEIYDCIKNFGVGIVKKKDPKREGSSSKSPSTVQIGNNRNEANLQYNKKCC